MPELEVLQKKYQNLVDHETLQLDMSRGKPSSEQLTLSEGLLDAALLSPPLAENGLDCRNYGGLEGIPEARRLFGALLGHAPDQVFVCGNSSLQLMYDCLAGFQFLGVSGHTPWAQQGQGAFLCPVPGYDRHFSMLEQLGLTMIPIPMRDDGPDMDLVEQYFKDPLVKGLICVPKYSNPEGKTYSDTVVRRFAALNPAAPDARIIWDNAYFVHDLEPGSASSDTLLNILKEAELCGDTDLFVEFASFSKISFSGAGVAALAASPRNLQELSSRMGVQTIGYDKLNQLRHARYFRDPAGVTEHMKQHAALLRPKFATVLSVLERELTGLATWTTPHGGYFIDLCLPEGCALRTFTLCKDAGVTLTPAGAAFPYGNDPEDRHLRIAPTFPSIEDLQTASEILALSAQIAILEQARS